LEPANANYLAVNSRLFGPVIEEVLYTAYKRVAADTWNRVNRQLTTPDRSYPMLVTWNFRHRHTVDEISWSSVLEVTMEHHGKLVLQRLYEEQSAISRDRPRF